MNYILFDGEHRDALLPFTYTRPVAEIRIGILTIREKWELFLGSTTTTVTEDYLSEKYPMVEMEHNIMINASYTPNEALVHQIKNLKENQAVYDGETMVAFFSSEDQEIDIDRFEVFQFEGKLLKIETTWDIFSKNGDAIKADFNLLTADRTSQPIPEKTVAFNPEAIFIEEGAQLPLCVLNATDGPIYIGKDAEIMEGSMVRGPFALCEGSTLKMGTKIYGPTTIGPHSKVGGEVNNSVFFGHSNKGHDGFLGNSVIGEWCNLGADTNNSNLKNNYAEVRLWSYESENFAKTGLQFCGLLMGDHSKCGINTMFNTGTVVGVSANIFGSGFPRNFIPSFSWGGAKGFTTYLTSKAFEVATEIMKRRGMEFSAQESAILEHVFELSASYRTD
ncbi:MAG: GlmU family protein [Flavobacteriaceae bacterium]|jgi:UDP-N-acetylglucosamine diphosphorylase/glucosamine-1-phosphate N-acetyltransferase|nr:glucose-1-phosphate thymidylyltransferase [Formosa sp.]MDG1375350.1 GlmU family protein [Flavobacteriaceae bacterium]MDG2498703.1 GlmU family protein [Flavobacteriaceae bacterium]